MSYLSNCYLPRLEGDSSSLYTLLSISIYLYFNDNEDDLLTSKNFMSAPRDVSPGIGCKVFDRGSW